jgi:serine/threonine protein kinase/tetratricopeptide (TPR) repeat protein
MSEDFSILGSSYRLLETHFGVDAIVLRAVDNNNEQIVAIRTPNIHGDGESPHLAKFTRESEQLAALDDPHILSADFFPSGTFDDRCYLVTEWMDCTLEEFLRERQPLQHEFATKLLQQVLGAVRALSANGAVHGKLTPKDFLVSIEDKAVKLGHLETSMETSDLIDRHPYVAPEVLEAGNDVDERSDIYSAGIIAYRLLLEREKFESGLLNVRSKSAIPTLNQLDARVGLGLSNVVERMVQREPKARYRSAEDAAAALMDAKDVSSLEAEDQSLQPLKEQAATQQTTPPRRHSRVWATVSSLAGIVVLVAALGFLWQWHSKTQQKEIALESLTSSQRVRKDALDTRAHKPTATASFAQAEQATARAKTALDGGDFAGAQRLAGRAQAYYAASIEEALERRAGAARDAAQTARRSAVQAEASATAAFEQADGYFSPAMHAFYEGQFIDAEQAFLAAKHGFETAIEAAAVEHARRRMESLRSSLLELDGGQDEVALQVGDRLRAEGDAHLLEGELEKAQKSFLAAEQEFAGVLDSLNARPVLVVRETAVRARHEAEHFEVGSLASFNAGLAQMAEGDEALAAGRFFAAQTGFEQARSQFELSRRQARALRRKGEMLEARDAAFAASISRQDPDAETGVRLFEAAERAIDKSSYEEAVAHYEQATEAFRAAWATAMLEKMRSLEKDAAAAKDAAESAGAGDLKAYRIGIGHFETAGRALRHADLSVAEAEFRAAHATFKTALAEARARAARGHSTGTGDNPPSPPDTAAEGQD